ncbi:glycosyltransferase family 2 protein [Nevskia soli]|uniref:glycosyltransferase family 2 protein n=1 Tax=Nevskia soli TaxID=418856 RepID=UPI0014701941|nr:glycosyltransferase family 2 protein [Nevskia soli]
MSDGQSRTVRLSEGKLPAPVGSHLEEGSKRVAPESNAKVITIIIAAWNGGKLLEQCLQSCLIQDYPHKEIVVIDGGSSDGTVEVLKKYSDLLTYWVSEPDRGIYNAWNKALQVATGDWICFLGVDDRWSRADSLSALANVARFPENNFVTARVQMIDGHGQLGRVFGGTWHYEQMKQWMIVAHTGMLHHRSLFEQYGKFDESYRIAGDFDFLLRAGRKIRAAFLADEVVLMGSEGVSSTRVRTVFSEGRRVLSAHPEVGPIKAWIFFFKAWSRYFLRPLTRLR